jgi:PqqD family protein of HPr-rel-A system
MSDILQSRLVPSPDAAESAVGDETVILHLKSGTYFGLDAMGTRIWTMLKDGVAPPAICERLSEEFDAEPHDVEDDVRRFLGELTANEILINS